MEIVRLAVNLARNCGYSVFPCRANKTPATPWRPGNTGGLHFASTDPDEIERLWIRYPGTLIGVRTGEASGVSVLDLDLCHLSAVEWLAEFGDRLPVTRTHLTRRSGWHLWMVHHPGLRCSQGSTGGRFPRGVDIRAEGGYAIHWPSAGLEVLDHSPPAPWPLWLAQLAQKPIEPPAEKDYDVRNKKVDAAPVPYDQIKQYDAAINGVIRRVSNAKQGEKRIILRDAAYTLGGYVAIGAISRSAAETALEAALPRTGANAIKSLTVARQAIAFGLDGGEKKPIQLENRERAA